MKRILAVLAVLITAVTVGASAAGAGQQSDTAPWYGGDLISSPLCCPPQFEEATTGFNLFDGTTYLGMTAGHFGGVGAPVLNGYAGAPMGHVSNHATAQDTDLFPVSYAAGYVWKSDTTVRTVYSWETTNQDIGTHVCTAGALTGHETCGAVNSFYNQPWLGGNLGVVSNCPGTTVCARPGDSGGPVYAVCTVTACNGEIEAVGTMVSAGAYSNGTHWVMWIPIRYIMAWVHTFDPAANLICVLCSHG